MRRRAAPAVDVAALIEALDEPAALCEADGALTLTNAAWREAVGPASRTPGGPAGLFAAFRAARRDRRGVAPWPGKPDGHVVSISVAGADTYLLRLRSDHRADNDPVTAAGSELRQQLAQRQKMEAVGQLAGGVAHDFNNLLSAVGMRVDELLLRHPLGDPAYENLSEVREGLNRAAALVLQLLTFSRKATVRREVLDLTVTLLDFEILLGRLLRENMRLETDYAADTPLVRVDKGQIETAIMNLVVNARDALRAGGGGTIRLRTARVPAAAAAGLGHPGPIPAGDLALIEVADDGPGIDPAVIDSIFEPFFTTKPAGEGTGLGLATVYGVVQQSGGAIIATSAAGRGAAFRIFLPACVARLAPPPAEPPPRRPPRDLSGSGLILFVEDEDRVRDIAARLLRERGYEVIEAADGEAALELAMANAGRIDLMISDVSMPGMDGPALLKAARPYLGAAPVMFISGYAESEFSDLLEGQTDVSFLAKPLRLQSLAEEVKARLRRS